MSGFDDYEGPPAPPEPIITEPALPSLPAAPAPLPLGAGRIPPHNADAEAAVLGACLLDPLAIQICEPLLKTADFYLLAHQVVWTNLVDMIREGREADLVTMQAQLHARGQLERAGGPVGLATLTEKVASASNVEAYARLVRERGQLRRMLSALATSSQDVYDRQDDAAAVLDATSERILAVAEARTNDFELAGAGWEPEFQMLKDSSEGRRPMGLPTKLAGWDRMLGGLVPKKTVVIGGRPGAGKSALLINMASNLSAQGIPVAVFSLEMDKLMIRNRLVAARASINGEVIEQGRMDPDQLAAYQSTLGAMAKEPMHIYYDPQLQLQQLLALARVAVSRLGAKAIFIDYMQLLDDDSRRWGTDAAKFSHICQRIAQFGRKHNVAIIEAAMLKRTEKDPAKDKPPRKEDLKESGGLEENADVVALLHIKHDDYEQRKAKLHIPVSCIIDKSRSGDTGWLELSYFGRYLRFESWA